MRSIGRARHRRRAEPARAVDAGAHLEVGVAVQTAFLADDGRLLQMPAVFPNLEYALQQVDEMRQMVINQFSVAQ